VAATTDHILTVADAAALAKCSPKTIYRAIKSGALVASGIGRGRAYRITQANFWRWMDGSVVQREPRSVARLAVGTAAAGSVEALRAIERDAA
jgi:excisionase family DNA binding protein